MWAELIITVDNRGRRVKVIVWGPAKIGDALHGAAIDGDDFPLYAYCAVCSQAQGGEDTSPEPSTVKVNRHQRLWGEKTASRMKLLAVPERGRR